MGKFPVGLISTWGGVNTISNWALNLMVETPNIFVSTWGPLETEELRKGVC